MYLVAKPLTDPIFQKGKSCGEAYGVHKIENENSKGVRNFAPAFVLNAFFLLLTMLSHLRSVGAKGPKIEGIVSASALLFTTVVLYLVDTGLWLIIKLDAKSSRRPARGSWHGHELFTLPEDVLSEHR